MGCYKTTGRASAPRVVRGNDFTAMVLVTRHVPSDGGKETEPVELSRCVNITARRVTRLGRRVEMGFTIDGSYLVVPFDDELPSGSYGFEATGKYANGRDWALRLMPGEFIDIVEPSSAGYTDGATERDVYEFSAVVLGESMSEAQMDRMNAAIETANSAAKEAAGLTEAMVSGEAERQANEELRKTAETGREDAEAARAKAEEERRKAEAERQAAEKLREDNVNDVRERVGTLEGKVGTLDGDETVEGSVRKRVKDAVAGLVGSAPDTLDTLQKIAEEMRNPEGNAAVTVLDQVAGKADKATTLEGYGITDAYTKEETDGKLGGKADKAALPRTWEVTVEDGAVVGGMEIINNARVGDTLTYGASRYAITARWEEGMDTVRLLCGMAVSHDAYNVMTGVEALRLWESPNAGKVYISLDDWRADNMVETTHAGLVRMMEEERLVPGTQYRITDYEPIFNEGKWGISSGPGQFDIIVTADGTDSVSEVARATWHVGDTYYERQNLDVWRVWYCPHNDYQLFPWCDYYRSKGVIYRLIDESGNDLPYDFKGMRFNPECTLFGNGTKLGTMLGVTQPIPTFWMGWDDVDASLFTDDDTSVPYATDNVVEAAHASRTNLSAEAAFARNIFVRGLTDFMGTFSNPVNNRLGSGSRGNIVCGGHVTLGKECVGNVLGGGGGMLFACHDVTMGDGCEDNFLDGTSIGDNISCCHHVSLGNGCKGNKFSGAHYIVLGDCVEYVLTGASRYVYVMPGVKAMAEYGMNGPIRPRDIGSEGDWEIIARADGIGGVTYSFTGGQLARAVDAEDVARYSVVKEV